MLINFAEFSEISALAIESIYCEKYFQRKAIYTKSLKTDTQRNFINKITIFFNIELSYEKMITYIKYTLPKLLYSKLEKCNFSNHEVLSLYNKHLLKKTLTA